MLVQDLCRTCLCTSGLRSLTSVDRDELLRWTGLKIDPNDDFPQSICHQCDSVITLSVKFRYQACEAEQKLIELKYDQMKYKKILFNDNQDLRLLTRIRDSKQGIIPNKVLKEDFQHLEVINETKLSVEPDCESALIVHYPNNVVEVITTGIEDLLDSILETNAKETIDIINDETDKSTDNHDYLSNDEDCRRAENSPKTKKYTRLDLIDGLPNKFGANICRLCKKDCPNLKAFYKHLNTKHFGIKKAILCEFCAMRFSDRQKLLRHCRARHGLARDDSFVCSHCDYRALDKEQLLTHERHTHTGERPCVCVHCGAGFYSERVLAQHARNHTSDKLYQCDKCPSKFKTRQRLCGHRTRVHVRRAAWACPACGVRRAAWACPACGVRRSKSPYVRAHMLREHGHAAAGQAPIRVLVDQ